MRTLCLTTCLLTIFSINIFSQNPISLVDMAMEKAEAVSDPDKMPEFPGGKDALLKFIKKNLRYPKETGRVKGRVVVKFIIDTEGKVTNAHVIKNANLYLDKEALRVVNLLPKWKPGEKYGKPANVYFVMPITFNPNAQTPRDRQLRDAEMMFNSLNNAKQ